MYELPLISAWPPVTLFVNSLVFMCRFWIFGVEETSQLVSRALDRQFALSHVSESNFSSRYLKRSAGFYFLCTQLFWWRFDDTARCIWSRMESFKQQIYLSTIKYITPGRIHEVHEINYAWSWSYLAKQRSSGSRVPCAISRCKKYNFDGVCATKLGQRIVIFWVN